MSRKTQTIWKIVVPIVCVVAIAGAAIGWQAHRNRAAGKLVEAALVARVGAEQGNADAEVTLGSLYYHGQGVPQDYSEALRLFQKSADQGYPSGQYHLGVMYYYGNAVTQDYRKAIRLYRNAADHGYPTAQDQLGTMSAFGIGLPQNYAEALPWYRKAANLRYARGEEHLGTMYYRGRGVAQNYVEAANWYRKAADQGDPEAEYDLGAMYHYGQGVPRSLAGTREWLRKAAAQGDEKALSSITFALLTPEKIVLRMMFALGLAFALNFLNLRTLRRKVTTATGVLILFSASYDWYGYMHFRILRPGYGVDAFTAFYWLLPVCAIASIVYIVRLERFSCRCAGGPMNLWPFSLKENGTPPDCPLHSNRKTALDKEPQAKGSPENSRLTPEGSRISA